MLRHKKLVMSVVEIENVLWSNSFKCVVAYIHTYIHTYNGIYVYKMYRNRMLSMFGVV